MVPKTNALSIRPQGRDPLAVVQLVLHIYIYTNIHSCIRIGVSVPVDVLVELAISNLGLRWPTPVKMAMIRGLIAQLVRAYG